MGCYRPNRAFQGYRYGDEVPDYARGWDGYSPVSVEEGWAQPKILKPLFSAEDGARIWPSEEDYPKKIKSYIADFKHVRELHLPCGHCTGCRLDNARMWSMRIMHEAKYSLNNHFITLTYSNETLPPDADLRYEDLRNFFKRARHVFQTPDTSFRYFACGEYGDKTLRPHYHFAAFDFKIPDLRPFKRTESGWYFISESLRETWGYGHVIVAPLEWSSAGYIARYVTKKMRGEDVRVKRAAANSDEEAEYYTVQRAFQSKGLGLRWYLDNKQEVWDLDACMYRGQYLVKVPRYYFKKLKEEDIYWAQSVEARRWEKAAEKQRPELDTERDRQLLVELQAKNLELNALKRSL